MPGCFFIAPWRSFFQLYNFYKIKYFIIYSACCDIIALANLFAPHIYLKYCIATSESSLRGFRCTRFLAGGFNGNDRKFGFRIGQTPANTQMSVRQISLS